MMTYSNGEAYTVLALGWMLVVILSAWHLWPPLVLVLP